jgi:hypothetical protein
MLWAIFLPAHPVTLARSFPVLRETWSIESTHGDDLCVRLVVKRAKKNNRTDPFHKLRFANQPHDSCRLHYIYIHFFTKETKLNYLKMLGNARLIFSKMHSLHVPMYIAVYICTNIQVYATDTRSQARTLKSRLLFCVANLSSTYDRLDSTTTTCFDLYTIIVWHSSVPRHLRDTPPNIFFFKIRTANSAHRSTRNGSCISGR